MQKHLIDSLHKHFTQIDHSAKIIETHCSVVFVLSAYAYKLKKSVDFGFLNYSTLEKRKHFCEEEIRLNKRLADNLYLGLVPISGTPDYPKIDDDSAPIEYLVKMRAFDSSAQLDLNLEKITDNVIKIIAAKAAKFHHHAETVQANSVWGNLDNIQSPVAQNFEQLMPLIEDPKILNRLETLKKWSLQQNTQLDDVFVARKANHKIRECHGDMHLRNMAFDGKDVLIFDGIEFNDSFRFIDVISDLAFLLMDLESKGLNPLSHLMLDEYLAHTGDFEGIALLNYYKSYRAMVRAKVAAFQMRNEDGTLNEMFDECLTYINLAETYMKTPQPSFAITVGVSGSGKSTESLNRVKASRGMVRLRSDVERKRCFKTPQYDETETKAVYMRLFTLTEKLLTQGISVVVDATFLYQADRKPFIALGQQLNIPCEQIWCDADQATLIERIEKRIALGEDVSDANLTVMKQQLSKLEPIEKS